MVPILEEIKEDATGAYKNPFNPLQMKHFKLLTVVSLKTYNAEIAHYSRLLLCLWDIGRLVP